MSDTSKRGKDFELLVASLIRRKIDKHAQRNKGSHANWHRRSDVYTELPIHLECKDHESIRIKEWFTQAADSCMGKIPVVAWQMEQEVLATLRFDDLLNLFVEIADMKEEIKDLKKPIAGIEKKIVEIHGPFGDSTILSDDPEGLAAKVRPVFTDGTLKREVKICKNGHICVPGRENCQTKGCQYSSTYIKPKAIKEKK